MREELGAGRHLDKHHYYKKKKTKTVNFSTTHIAHTEAPDRDLFICFFLFGLAEPTATREL